MIKLIGKGEIYSMLVIFFKRPVITPRTCLASVQTTVHQDGVQACAEEFLTAPGYRVTKVAARWVVRASAASAPAPTLLDPHLDNLESPPSEAR